MCYRVVHDFSFKNTVLAFGRQATIYQEISRLEEGRVYRELLDRIAST